MELNRLKYTAQRPEKRKHTVNTAETSQTWTQERDTEDKDTRGTE